MRKITDVINDKNFKKVLSFLGKLGIYSIFYALFFTIMWILILFLMQYNFTFSSNSTTNANIGLTILLLVPAISSYYIVYFKNKNDIGYWSSLKEKGAISEDEFNEKKKELLKK